MDCYLGSQSGKRIGPRGHLVNLASVWRACIHYISVAFTQEELCFIKYYFLCSAAVCIFYLLFNFIAPPFSHLRIQGSVHGASIHLPSQALTGLT